MVTKDFQRVTKELPLRTPANARDELFTRKGVSISAWALENGLTPQTVFDLLSGRCKGHRGAAHRAAVLLGLKHGDLPEDGSAA